VYLFNTTTNALDTLIIKEHFLSFKKNINDQTLYHLMIDGFNNDRPLNLILSNEKTEVEFGSLTKVVMNQNIRNSFLPQPILKRDPNRLRILSVFFNLLLYPNFRGIVPLI
jgi:hypothetical protein